MKSVKVFGIGLQRTGTTTLGKALSILGYKTRGFSLDCCNLYRDNKMQDLMKLTRQFDSFNDWPWPLIYKDLFKEYPTAIFILTVRKDEATWLGSMKSHAKYTTKKRQSCPEKVKRIGAKSFRGEIYGYEDPHEYSEHYLDFYRRHNEAVREFFSDNPESLIEVCWENRSDWEQLCHPLGEPVTDTIEFPHVNKRRN